LVFVEGVRGEREKKCKVLIPTLKRPAGSLVQELNLIVTSFSLVAWPYGHYMRRPFEKCAGEADVGRTTLAVNLALFSASLT